MSPKKPKHNEIPWQERAARNVQAPPGTGARNVQVPVDFREERFRWEVNRSYIDMDGYFGWRKASPDEILYDAVMCLQANEKRKWKEVLNDQYGGRDKRRAKNHDMPVSRMEKVACDRLREIGKDDEEKLFSLHVAGTQRIWGVRRGSTLYILCGTPNMKFYLASEKCHT